MQYEALLHEAITQHSLYIYEKHMPKRIKGLQSDNVIWLNKKIPTSIERTCILAEEIGHYQMTAGDILDQTKLMNRKQELKARQWAAKKLIPLHKIAQAHQEGIKNRYELACFLEVTEEFLDFTLQRYEDLYGLTATIEGYTICFNPLGVVEWFDF